MFFGKTHGIAIDEDLVPFLERPSGDLNVILAGVRHLRGFFYILGGNVLVFRFRFHSFLEVDGDLFRDNLGQKWQRGLPDGIFCIKTIGNQSLYPSPTETSDPEAGKVQASFLNTVKRK